MIKRFIHRWAETVINRRLTVIVVALVLLGVAVIPMKNLYFDNSNELFFVEDDPHLLAYNQFLDLFDDSESVSVAIEARQGEDSVFTPDILRIVRTITEYLENNQYVNKVSSLANYQYIHSENDTLSTTDLVEDWDAMDNNPALMNKIKQIMEKETLVHGSLLSKDMKSTVVFARTVYIRGKNEHKVEITTGIKKLIADNGWEKQGYKIHYFGVPILQERFETLSKQDQALVNPVMVIVILVILYFSFRAVIATLLPLVVILGSLVYVTGIQGFMVWPYNSVLTALPAIIIIVGIGDSVHLIVEFFHYRNQGLEPRESAKSTIKGLWLPCFYTSATTAVGFLSLTITRIAPIRQFGLLAASASLIAFVISLTVLPAILSYFRFKPKKVEAIMDKGLVARFTGSLTGFTYKNRYLLTAMCLILIIISAVLANQIEVDNNYASYFKKESKLRQDIDYFDKTFKGAMMLDFMIDTGKPGGVLEPELLRNLERLQQYLDTLGPTGKAVSFADYIKKMNQAMHNDDPVYNVIPDTREAVAQYLLLYESSGPEENFSDLKTADGQYARVYTPLSNMTSLQMHIMMNGIRKDLAENFPNVDIQLTGNVVLYVANDTYIHDGVLKSFGIALLIIGLCFFIIFRSVKHGVIALIPSIFPIIFTGAIMYLLGISLNFGTMIIGAMTIGIAVDDSIHVMNRYLLDRRAGMSVKESVNLALTEAGRAVIFSSVVLVLGFSTMFLGSFMPFIYTGIISAAIMTMALLGDLFFLPAIIFVWDGIKEKK